MRGEHRLDALTREERAGVLKRRRGVARLIVAVLIAGVGLIAWPSPAGAVTTVAQFDSVRLVENPNGWRISGLANTLANAAGHNFGRIHTTQSPATGVVIEYDYATPRHQLTALQLYNNGGQYLADRDGIGTALVEVLDPSGAVLFSGPLNAGNGGAPFLTTFPTPLDDVATVRLSEITNLTGGAVDIIWRLFRGIQNVATPIMSTAINADGFSDDVTISGTEGLAGDLTWTLYGPVPFGPGGSCAEVDWADGNTFDSGTVVIPDDGTYTITPVAGQPTDDGCYSYESVLSSIYYSTDVTSAVGQQTETFSEPPTPRITTTIAADGFSDDITIAGTHGIPGELEWTLLGPVDAGPSGTCDDADFTTAPAFATGTEVEVVDQTVTVTPPRDPTASGCYTYESVLSGGDIVTTISERGLPEETFARPASPSMSTRISADGYRDDVTISDTAGFAGTLTWTAVGPVSVRPGGTCDDADFTAPALFNTDTEPVIGDGTMTITPAVGPTDEGCYSYGVVLDGPNFTAQVVSPVGLPEETLFQPAPPTTTTTTTTTTTPTTTVAGSPPTSAAATTTEPGAAPPPGAAPGVTTTTDPGPAAPPTGLLPATGRGGSGWLVPLGMAFVAAGAAIVALSRLRAHG